MKPPIDIEFTGCRPVLQVGDVRRSLRFYLERLGFSEGWGQADQILNASPDDPDRVRFCYVFCSYFELFLREVAEPQPGEIVIGCPSTEAVDHAYEQYLGRGVKVDEAPANKPWWTYGMTVRDPDGNVLRILH